MSLIHRSLEQIRRKERTAVKKGTAGNETSGGTPGGKRLLIFAGVVVLAGVAALAGVYILRSQMDMTYTPPPKPAAVSAQANPAAESQAKPAPPADSETETAKPKQSPSQDSASAQGNSTAGTRSSAAVPAAENTTAAVETGPEDAIVFPVAAPAPDAAAIAAGQPAGGDREKIMDLTSPPQPPSPDQMAAEAPGNPSLDRLGAPPDGQNAAGKPAPDQEEDDLGKHFREQARRNVHLQQTERRLAQAFKAGDQETVRQALQELESELGGESPSVLKWQGYLAMKQDDLEYAESCFRLALTAAPESLQVRYNLILVLIRRHKIDEAAVRYELLHRDYPQHPTIMKLGEAFKGF